MRLAREPDPRLTPDQEDWRMRKWLALLVACLALGVVAAGCGGDDNGGGGSAATTTTEQQTTKTEAAGGGKTVAVEMKDISFQPGDISVAKGGTVTWTNEDDVNHDVTKTGGPGPDFSSGTGDLAKGDTYRQKFDTAGTIEYVCTVHPNMTAKITVK
jgi:plastocyanin